MKIQLICISQRNEGCQDVSLLEDIAKLLVANPDVYTLWNYRREILLTLKDANQQTPIVGVDNDEAGDIPDEKVSPVKDFQSILEREQELTVACFERNPKSYCAWFQRGWILENIPSPDLQQELKLCNKLLDLDERNFHCWDYRRYVSKKAQVNVQDELKFTLGKIQQNFSNFSSWHYRTSLLTSSEFSNSINFSEKWASEYELVENAIYTDPTDQSAWFYHKWLSSTNFGNNVMKRSKQTDMVKIQSFVVDLKSSFIGVTLNHEVKHWEHPFLLSSEHGNMVDKQFEPVQRGFTKFWFLDKAGIAQLDYDGTIKFDKANYDILKYDSLHSSEVNDQFILSEENLNNLKALRDMEPDSKCKCRF